VSFSELEIIITENMKSTPSTVVAILAILGAGEAREKKMLRLTGRGRMGAAENKAVQLEDVMFWMRNLQMGR
jgi:hypothetical protein